jgi:hypothetical protein
MTPHLISLKNVQFALKGGNLFLYGRFSQHLPCRRRSIFVLFMTSQREFALERKRQNGESIVPTDRPLVALVKSLLMRIVPIKGAIMTVTNGKLITSRGFFPSFVSIEIPWGANRG